MDLIVAVYDNWGIGCDGTQPVALSADRKFFREMTRGALVIAGRKTVADFPGGKPLPGRTNVVLSKTVTEMPGFTVVSDVAEVLKIAENAQKAMVIGGASVYRALLCYCKRAIVTKVHCTVSCDTFFPDLDACADWCCTQTLRSGEENGIRYEMCLYENRGTV